METINSTSNIIITGTSDADFIENSADSVTINAGDGNDNIENRGSNVSISAGAGSDTVTNNAEYVTILGGAGNDTLYAGSNHVYINGGAGNDDITASNYGTIEGGTGDDTLNFVGFFGDNYTIIYHNGDGNDVVTMPLTNNNTLQLDEGTEYSTTVSGNDLVYQIGEGSITFSLLAGQSMNVTYGESSDDTDTTSGGETDTDTTTETTDTDTTTGGEISQVNVRLSLASGDGYFVIPVGNTSTAPTAVFETELAEDDTLVGTVTGSTGSHIYTATDTYRQRIIVSGSGIITSTSTDDTITSSQNSNVTINSGEGNDIISVVSGADILINAEAGDDTISSNGIDTALINGGAGNDTIRASGNNSYVDGDDGDDKIYSSGYNVYTHGGAGNDSIRNYGNLSAVYGDAGDDTINNSGLLVTIYGGAGNDSIVNSGINVVINGGEGDDEISNSVQLTTINGGVGDDKITLSTAGNVIQYAAGDGNDTIYNFNSLDTISIPDGTEHSSTVIGNDIIITVGEGSMTLIDATTLSSVNIVTDTIVSSFVNVNLNNAPDSESGAFYVVQGGESTDASFVPLDSEVLNYNGHLYSIYSNRVDTWEAAETFCESLGGHLAVINDAEENTALFNYMTGSGISNAFFGFSDADSEGTWSWVNGEDSSYTNWAENEPNGGSSENYAMFYESSDYQWNDSNFSSPVNFICEWDFEGIDFLGDVTADKVYTARSDASYEQAIIVPGGWSVTASEENDALYIQGNNATVAGGGGADAFYVASGVHTVTFADFDTSSDSLTFAAHIEETSLLRDTSSGQLILGSDEFVNSDSKMSLTFQNQPGLSSDFLSFDVQNGSTTNTIKELIDVDVRMNFSHWKYRFTPSNALSQYS